MKNTRSTFLRLNAGSINWNLMFAECQTVVVGARSECDSEAIQLLRGCDCCTVAVAVPVTIG